MPHLRFRNLLLGVLAASALGACSPAASDGADGTALATSTQALSAQGAVARARKGPPTDAVCTVTPGDGTVLVTGTVLAPEGVLHNGHVLYGADGVIQCVGKACDKEAAALTATRIDCHKGVISPGLINGHDHVTYQDLPYVGTDERYEHRHDWRIGNNGHTRINTPGGASTANVQWG